MPDKPTIPMTPEELPQQRVYPVEILPARPSAFQGYFQNIDPISEDKEPKGSPRNVEYLCSVEWAWAMNNNRIDNYYLNPRGKYWFLWNWFQDDNTWNLDWVWFFYAYGLKKGVNAKEAAIYLLMDAWQAEAKQGYLDCFHWINDVGTLSVAEIQAIAKKVWPGCAEPEEDF